MDKDSLIKQINIFLDESPFEDDEIFFWQKNMREMDEKELEELFSLLKDKLKIITDANNLFIKIAEDEIQERDKKQESIPEKASIVDMTINDLADVFNGNILDILKDENTDIFSDLDKYFNNSKLLGEDVVKSFDILIKSLYENKNIFTKKYDDLKSVTVGDWLKFYNVFNDNSSRTSIDRVSFVNNHEKSRKLDQERKDVLLKLLKLYDFLLNPESVEIGARPPLSQSGVASSPLSQRGGRGDFSEAGVGNIGLTAATRDSGKKESASESIVDKNELNRRKIPPSAFGSRPPLEKGVGEQAKRAYVFSLAEQVLIKQNEEDIKRVARGNIILVGKELTKAVEAKNRPRVIAALRIAVKNNLLLGWSWKHEKRETEHEKREDNKIVISFLRSVLQEKLGLSENEAAKIGVHLYNLFRKLGRDIGYLAYYDEKEQKFYWMGE